MFKISQVSEIIKKDENFIRQHIHRGHLQINKIDSKVFVKEEELRRWAKKKDLAVDEDLLKVHARAEMQSQFTEGGPLKTNRALCAKILLLKKDKGLYLLGMVIKLRKLSRQNRVSDWSTKVFGEDKFILLEKYSDSTTWVEDFIFQISQGITINGYAFKGHSVNFTKSILGQGETGSIPEFPMASPFKGYSAECYESWNLVYEKFALVQDLEGSDEMIFKDYDLDLRKYPEKIGNIFIVDALDDLRVHCKCIGGNVLRIECLSFPSTDELSAVVLVKRHELVIGKQLRKITSSITDIVFDNSFNFFDCMLFNSKGECVDHQSFYLLEEIHMMMMANTGSVHVQNKSGETALIIPQGITQKSIIGSDSSAKSFKEILSQGRLLRAQFEEKKTGRLFDFSRNDTNNFVEKIVKILGEQSRENSVIYLCEPYFLRFLNSNEGKIFLLKLCGRMSHNSIRVICGQLHDMNFIESIEKIKKELGTGLLPGLHIKSIGKIDRENKLRPYFHNRWITNMKGTTYMFTNSLNSVSEDGASIVKVPTDFFERQSEALWNLVEHDPSLKIEEINL